MNKSNLLLLTGAGFSIDFLDSNFKEKLTTDFLTKLITNTKFFNEIFKDLDNEEINKDSIKNTIKKYKKVFKDKRLQNQISNENKINFEQLIYYSELINGTNEEESRYYNNPGGKIFAYALKPKFKIAFSIDDIKIIKSLILQVISKCFQLNKKNAFKLKQFNALLLKNKTLLYHTLNYDLVYEKAIQNSQIECNHIHGQVNLVANKFEVDDYLAEENRHSILSGITVSNSNEYLYDFDMITGYDKPSKLMNDYYSKAYQKFILDTQSSKEIIIIGYSFNDEHINCVLRNNLPIYQKIRIVGFEFKEENYNDAAYSIINKIFNNGIHNTEIDYNEVDLKKNNSEGYNFTKRFSDEKEINIEFYFSGTMHFIEKYLN